ncbi:hypothetical protein M408DRAFT_260895 [Serendipita vermifera MAFF 305830]|uniref:Expansin-like EG45 domain-containing protein n=1 Tax=Serendipita vermifera MAFF 305830 TaxID=933852 RepID=A0A0C2XRF1_SERVB|nr:hypothetical protein M408DRAFT_260895 [Serendipita vermifera MAFF 305830]
MLLNVARNDAPFNLSFILYFIIFWLSIGQFQCALADVWAVPAQGFATITHYTLPLDYIASCGCTAKSTHYPTAALSSLAFGSTQNFGPGCGACYRLKPLNTFLSTPPYYPPESELQSIVVKITDLCPTWSAWCEATPTQPNRAGNFLNFDLALSDVISSNFFPSNESYYGYADFGVWNATYEATSCSNWSGWNDPAALGSVTNLGDSVCCPADTSNVTCPSFSEEHGDPVPPTGSQGAAIVQRSVTVYTPIISAILLVIFLT